MSKIILASIVIVIAIAVFFVLSDSVKFVSLEPSQSIVENANIRVFSPFENQEVGLPLVIKGEVRTFEKAFAYRILDEDGTVLLLDHAMSSGETDIGEFDGFELHVNYPQPKGKTGKVEVFEYSAKDGSEINKVSINVRFADVESQIVNVYFGNTTENSGAEDCSEVFKVERRIAKTSTPIKAAIEELLKGPTISEGLDGYITSIGDGVRINGISVSNNIAKADFSRELQIGMGGSCTVTSIRSQIEHTLLEFSSIGSVVISVDGKSDDVLQP